MDAGFHLLTNIDNKYDFCYNFCIMQIPELAKKLQSLGLTDKEARVYVAALFLGPSPVQKIGEQAGVNRATTYVILDQLADFGLVSQSNEGKKTVFIAEEPEALDKLFDIQLRQIEARKQELKKVLPELKKSQRVEDVNAPSVRFYRGIEGIKAINAYAYKKERDEHLIYAMSNYDEVLKIFPDILKFNPQKRLKKKISSKVIYSFESGEIKTDPKLLRETKKVSSPIKADINLHEKTASFLTYNGDKSVGIILENKEIVEALRQLFEMAWDKKNK